MRTLFDKVWDAHLVHQDDGGPALLYVDLHLVHEVTSPQAFEGLRLAGRRVRRPDLTLATVDHNVPTGDRRLPIADEVAARQLSTLVRNAREAGIELHDLDSPDQGIVHVIGPELGLTQPGAVIVCGDSHTSTHGAFGALAFGIGTSEVEHVLATQCVVQSQPRTMEVRFLGPAAAWRRGQGPHPRADPPDRHRRRHRPRAGVHRRGDPRPLDGGADDGLQHVHRGRRARGDDRAGRDHVRVPRVAAARAEGRGLAPSGERVESAPQRSGRAVRPHGRHRCGVAGTAGHLGHQPGHDGGDHRARARSRGRAVGGGAAVVPPRARVHGPEARHTARRPAGGSGVPGLLHQRPHRRSARGGERRAWASGGERACGRWSCPARSA